MEPLQQPTVLILGAGAVGLSLAGKLHGVATACVACRQVHASAIMERGLVIEGVWGDRTVRGIRCVMGPEDLPTSIDFIIITAKGTDTRAICEEYAAVIRDRPTATLQNGIGNEEIIAEYTDTVIGGTVTTNFSVLGPGHVRVLSESAPMRLGIWSGGADAARALDRLIALIRSASIPVEAEPDIRAGKWAKALLNIAVNPICALLRAPVGVAADPELRETVSSLIRETFAVAGAEGVKLPWATPDEYLGYLFGVQIPDFAAVYPSMYYDLQRGRRTEIDLLNGYIAAAGERRGIETPYNRCITALVRSAEKQPGRA